MNKLHVCPNNNLSNFTVMRNASGVNQFKAVDQNGNNGMLFKVKDNSEFSVNVWKDNAFGNEKILATKDDFNYTDVRITTSANNSIAITEAPKGSEYIPVIVAHRETNNCQDTVTYDGGIWKICSTVSQETAIRFYHMPIS